MRRGTEGTSRQSNYTNPCLTMHQPWASLLVHGIKRIEGRSWPSPIRGRLWIHAAGKIPDDATIKAMEDFYRQIYAVDGVFDIKFPEHYPVSRLIGCVDIVGCVKGEELESWAAVPPGVRLEALTSFCWLCEKPQKLLVPFEMRGYQGVYNLEKKINEAAVRGLHPVKGPLPVSFPLLNPRDLFSLKPGSITVGSINPKPAAVGASSDLGAAIAGARAAASQFSKNSPTKSPTSHQKLKSVEVVASSAVECDEGNLSMKLREQTGDDEVIESHKSRNEISHPSIVPSQASTTEFTTANQYEKENSQLDSEGIGKRMERGNVVIQDEVPQASTNRPHLASNKLFSAAIGKLEIQEGLSKITKEKTGA